MTNLSRIAENIARELEENHPERRVRFEITEGLNVYADERLMEVALKNLFENAWKYTARKDDALIEFKTTIREGRQVFFIRDNGTGFNMKYADKLFAPFQRLHGPEFHGTGIGLAIVQRVINRHGGRIWAESVEGEGATFCFYLGH